jgi:hypothetical protein
MGWLPRCRAAVTRRLGQREQGDACGRAGDRGRHPRLDAHAEEEAREQGDRGRDRRHHHAGRHRRRGRDAEQHEDREQEVPRELSRTSSLRSCADSVASPGVRRTQCTIASADEPMGRNFIYPPVPTPATSNVR